MKLKEATSNYNEALDEFKQLCSKEFSFLSEYEKIDYMPELESIEIFTKCCEIEELIPAHLAKIKEQLLKGKKVYVRVMPEITLGKFDEVGLYTRMILV
jgi:hypothetical protein